MERILVTVAVNAAAWPPPPGSSTASRVRSDGADTSDQVVTLLLVAALFGVVNAFVPPIVKLLSLPFFILTLGLFLFVVNALMLLLTAGSPTGARHRLPVDGFWTAVWGALVISLVGIGARRRAATGADRCRLRSPPPRRRPGGPYRVALVCLGNICRSPMATWCSPPSWTRPAWPTGCE